ncbi:MAG TPA: hypothetical protein VEH10_00625 [Thermoplasmata archaeon]|nr:hypothetical protein [Thermoplasmata archaeon]
MSDVRDADLADLQRRTLDRYAVVTLLMLVGIAILVAYAIRLGPLTSPGAQQSFGYAVALMALMGAVIFHVADRTYRVWPLGRRVRPTPPAPITLDSWVRFLKVLIVVLAVAGIAYMVGELLA